MGYYTDFELEIHGPNGEENISNFPLVAENYSQSWYLESLLANGGYLNGKWYEHAATFKAVSSDFPEHIFSLRGIGEEQPDMWVKRFKNGKMQTREAQISYAPFDPYFTP